MDGLHQQWKQQQHFRQQQYSSSSPIVINIYQSPPGSTTLGPNSNRLSAEKLDSDSKETFENFAQRLEKSVATSPVPTNSAPNHEKKKATQRMQESPEAAESMFDPNETIEDYIRRLEKPLATSPVCEINNNKSRTPETAGLIFEPNETIELPEIQQHQRDISTNQSEQNFSRFLFGGPAFSQKHARLDVSTASSSNTPLMESFMEKDVEVVKYNPVVVSKTYYILIFSVKNLRF